VRIRGGGSEYSLRQESREKERWFSETMVQVENGGGGPWEETGNFFLWGGPRDTSSGGDEQTPRPRLGIRELFLKARALTADRTGALDALQKQRRIDYAERGPTREGLAGNPWGDDRQGAFGYSCQKRTRQITKEARVNAEKASEG